MNKFIVLTRGRTGSTAIIDELNNVEGIFAEQELFTNYKFEQAPTSSFFKVLPFIWWKKDNSFKKPLFTRKVTHEKALAEIYLSEAEKVVKENDAECFGFKVLSNNLFEKKFLTNLLLNNEYKVLYLTRNVARQVVSGMIANKRGIFNTREEVEDNEQYWLDLNELKSLLGVETREVERDIKLLESSNFDYMQINYEEFCSNRSVFFRDVLSFLNLSESIPEESDYSIVISDLKHTIRNYDEVVTTIKDMGLELV